MHPFLRTLGIELPLIQAPMAGVSTPEMAAAVSNAGGLGSIGAGAVDADATRRLIAAVRARTERPFQVNVFCHKPAVADAVVEVVDRAPRHAEQLRRILKEDRVHADVTAETVPTDAARIHA